MESIKKYFENSNASHKEKGNHKMISNWTYYCFKKDTSNSYKTLEFITKSIKNKSTDHKILNIFYSSLNIIYIKI